MNAPTAGQTQSRVTLWVSQMQPKVFLSQREVERETRRGRPAIVSAIERGIICPDAILKTAGRESFLFDAAKLPELKAAMLATGPEVAA